MSHFVPKGNKVLMLFGSIDLKQGADSRAVVTFATILDGFQVKPALQHVVTTVESLFYNMLHFLGNGNVFSSWTYFLKCFHCKKMEYHYTFK